jgi:hypothetical protein
MLRFFLSTVCALALFSPAGAQVTAISLSAPSPTSVCPGAQIQASYSVTGNGGAGNVFTLELSNAAGSFSNPVVLGTQSGSSSGSVSGTVPSNTLSGNGYLVRVRSSVPAVTSNTQNISVLTSPFSPTINPGGPTTFCSGGSVQLVVAAQSGVTYSWQRNGTAVGTGSLFTAAQGGTYQVVASNSSCSVTGAPLTVTVESAPSNPTINPPLTTNLCPGQIIALSTTAVSGYTYLWKRNGANVGTNSASFSASQTGSYTVTVSNACGTATTPAVVINTGTAPAAPALSSPQGTVLCGTSTLVLVAPSVGAASYQWKANGSNIGTDNDTLLVSAPATYTLVLSNACGSTNSSNSIVVTTAPVPLAPTINATGTGFCPGSSATLSVPQQQNVTYQWKRNGTNIGTNSFQLIVNQAGTYTVGISNACGSVVSTNSIAVDALSAPQSPVIAYSGGTGLCSGDTAFLDAPNVGQAFYTWYLNGSFIGGGNPFGATQTGVYTVLVTNACGSSTSAAYSLTQGTSLAVPTITIQGQQLCSNGSPNLQWLNSQMQPIASSACFTPPGFGTFYAQVSNNGCSAVSAPFVVALTDLEMHNEKTIKMVPNPSAGTVCISGATGLQTVHIFDALGALCWQGNGPVLDLTSLPSGLYLVMMHTTDGWQKHRLVLEPAR